MAINSNLSFILPQALKDDNKRRLHWIIPVFVLVLYVLVIFAFIAIQNIQQKHTILYSGAEEVRHQLLIFLVVAMSFTIVISLLTLWHYTRIRSEAEGQLFLETAFRRAMENSMSTGMRVLDLQGRVVYVNPAFCRMVGWTESELIGTLFPYPYWVDDKFEQHEKYLNIVLSGKTPSSGMEMEARRRDGSIFTARLYVSPLRDHNGEQIGWMTSMTDITEPKRIREALTAAHERFMTVLESLDDTISVVADTPNGPELLFANRTYRRLWGSEAHGHTLLHNADTSHHEDHNKENNEFYIPHIDTWFEVHHRILNWTDGRKVRLQVARDISQRREYERKLRAQQEKVQLSGRLSTLGEMASSLAHELNQPLTAIVNYNTAIAALIKSDNLDQDRLLQVLDKSVSQAERAGRIIARIRDFVRRNEPERQAVKIDSIIDNTMDLAIFESRKYNKQIEVNLPEGLPEVYVDPILIEQVLLNLIKNGLEAMSQSEQEKLYVHVSQVGREIQVQVIDSGHGITDVERLFEPFYSTKKEGLGIGLNICRSIIEAHRGRLWAENNPGGGTIFSFKVPCYQKPEN
jgi:PAS domain S-box-containing protein